MSSDEAILELGAEGGSLKVIRRSGADGGAEYMVLLRDQSLMLLDESEAGSEIRRDFGWVSTLDAALKQLDRYPWAELYPIAVHSDVRREVLVAVKERLKDRSPDDRRVMRWERLCAPTPAAPPAR